MANRSDRGPIPNPQENHCFVCHSGRHRLRIVAPYQGEPIRYERATVLRPGPSEAEEKEIEGLLSRLPMEKWELAAEACGTASQSAGTFSILVASLTPPRPFT